MNAKTFFPILALCCFFVGGQTGSFVYYDDIYTKSTDAQYHVQKTEPAQTETVTDNQYYQDNNYNNNYDNSNYDNAYSENYSADTQEAYSDGAGNTYITNNHYYDDNDVYDYYYSSRLKRFHTTYYTGFGYYDPYYTTTMLAITTITMTATLLTIMDIETI